MERKTNKIIKPCSLTNKTLYMQNITVSWQSCGVVCDMCIANYAISPMLPWHNRDGFF